ncbi:MAG: BatA domain-containing protein, partial [Planctomycetaceae bacterium]
MSFLFPLYVAGLLAVSLPVLFHLLRRTPRGRLPFSTLMFLEPSPPRITRRSRLDQWPLLLLRALAVCLLAFAFARPFLRDAVTAAASESQGRRIVVLIDSSASMRREGLWNDAITEAERIIARAAPADRVAIRTFDHRAAPLVTFEQWSALEPASRAETVTARLKELEPGWGGTDLGTAVIVGIEDLQSLAADEDGVQTPRQLVIISDLQSGSRLEALKAFEWPEDVTLELVRVEADAPTNAGIQIVGDAEHGAAAESLPVRVFNAADSTREQFTLSWSGGT